MSRVCDATGKKVLAGNNVSHAHNKSRRRFLPNLQVVSLMSDTLGKPVRLRLSTRGLRTIEKQGGIDTYLLGAKDAVLSADALKVKRQIKRAQKAA